MVLHPDVQRKAQKQLDDVVGTDRLPEFKDIAFLPYVEAIVKELFRWHPVTPLGTLLDRSTCEPANFFLSHSCRPYIRWGWWIQWIFHTERYIDHGQFLVRSSLNSAHGGNVLIHYHRKILHEEKAYPDPMAFKPERFIRPDGSLDPDVRDPMVAAFGFGRRWVYIVTPPVHLSLRFLFSICPGRHMAVNGALITIATLLATFNIEQAYDESGDPLVKEDKMTSGLISCVVSHRILACMYTNALSDSYPLPFKCKITPRSETAVRLIKQVNGDLLA